MIKRCFIIGILVILCMNQCACSQKKQGQEETSAFDQETIQMPTEALVPTTETTEQIDDKSAKEETETKSQIEFEEITSETAFKVKEENVSYGENMTDKG